MDRGDARTSTPTAGASPDPTAPPRDKTGEHRPAGSPGPSGPGGSESGPRDRWSAEWHHAGPLDDAVAIQVERVETLLAAVRDIVSSLGATSAQLEREVAQALRPAQGAAAYGGDPNVPDPQAGDIAASAAALEAERAALLEAVEHRAVIEQAKGMLMLKHRCDADNAFGLLLDISRRERRKVRDISADLVRAGTTPRPMVDLTQHAGRPAATGAGSGDGDRHRSS